MTPVQGGIGHRQTACTQQVTSVSAMVHSGLPMCEVVDLHVSASLATGTSDLLRCLMSLCGALLMDTGQSGKIPCNH